VVKTGFNAILHSRYKKRSLSPKKVTNQLRKKDKYGGKYRSHSATIHASPTIDSQMSLTLVSDP
jgi:hypothetical protein